jgi:hypothetical protein
LRGVVQEKRGYGFKNILCMAPNLDIQHQNPTLEQQIIPKVFTVNFQQFCDKKFRTLLIYTKQKVMGGSIVNLVFVTMTYKTGLIYIGGIQIHVIPIWIHHLLQCGLGSGSRDLMNKNCKILQLKKNIFLYEKLQDMYPPRPA